MWNSNGNEGARRYAEDDKDERANHPSRPPPAAIGTRDQQQMDAVAALASFSQVATIAAGAGFAPASSIAARSDPLAAAAPYASQLQQQQQQPRPQNASRQYSDTSSHHSAGSSSGLEVETNIRRRTPPLRQGRRTLRWNNRPVRRRKDITILPKRNRQPTDLRPIRTKPLATTAACTKMAAVLATTNNSIKANRLQRNQPQGARITSSRISMLRTKTVRNQATVIRRRRLRHLTQTSDAMTSSPCNNNHPPPPSSYLRPEGVQYASYQNEVPQQAGPGSYPPRAEHPPVLTSSSGHSAASYPSERHENGSSMPAHQMPPAEEHVKREHSFSGNGTADSSVETAAYPTVGGAPRGKPEAMAKALAASHLEEHTKNGGVEKSAAEIGDSQPVPPKKKKATKKSPTKKPPSAGAKQTKSRKKVSPLSISSSSLLTGSPSSRGELLLFERAPPISEGEYENLEEMMTQFCRVPLLAEFSRPVALLHPEVCIRDPFHGNSKGMARTHNNLYFHNLPLLSSLRSTRRLSPIRLTWATFVGGFVAVSTRVYEMFAWTCGVCLLTASSTIRIPTTRKPFPLLFRLPCICGSTSTIFGKNT